MKRLENCKVENCIPTPSSCIELNLGTVDYLGICDGDSLNNLLIEIITKLQEIAGNDLSEFDIDSLLDICNQNAPSEVTLISILNIVKNNQICLKDFIDKLSEQLSELLNEQAVNINLKCYAEFDNLGNSLSITRDELDQLIIDNLCNHKGRIETLEGKVISLQSQIDNLDIPDTTEPQVATCVNPATLPLSSQIISIADAHCDLETATGDSADISSALANTPAGMNAEFGLLPGWILAPTNLAENYNNLLIAFGNVWSRLQTIEDTCCAVTCDDVKIGFSAVYNEDSTGLILRFTSGAGTSIPAGFTDLGSTITITDVDGNTVEFITSPGNLIANNAEIEIVITGLSLLGDLTVSIDVNIGNGSITCSKCVTRTVKKAQCAYCEVCVSGNDGSVVIVYEDNGGAKVYESFNPTTTTTSSSTTTTTTMV